MSLWGRKQYNADASQRLMEILANSHQSATAHQEVEADVRELLKKGADPNAWQAVATVPKTKNSGCYALWLACRHKHRGAAELLLKAGANVNQLSRMGDVSLCTQDALGQALSRPDGMEHVDYRLIKLLVDYKADVRGPDKKDFTHIMDVPYSRQELEETGINPVRVMVESLPQAERKAYANAVQKDGRTALHNAFSNMPEDSLGFIPDLLEYGANLNAPYLGHTPPACLPARQFANCSDALPELLHLLDKYGFDYDHAVQPHRNALPSEPKSFCDYAIKEMTSPALLRALLEKGQEPGNIGMSVLAHPAYANPKDMRRVLVDHGFDCYGHQGNPPWRGRMQETMFRANSTDPDRHMLGHTQTRIGYVANEGGMKLSEFTLPFRRPDMMLGLCVLKDGPKLFDAQCWRKHPEERRMAFLTLPARARKWLIEIKPELAELEPKGLVDSPATLLKDGKLSLDDYLAPDGNAGPQLLVWWPHVNTMMDPQTWREGSHDVVRVFNALPKEFTPDIDIAHHRRDAAFPRSGSVLVRHLTEAPGRSDHGVV